MWCRKGMKEHKENNFDTVFIKAIMYNCMGHYQKMEQSLSLMVFSQARCPSFAFSMYNISFRGALLEPHAISRFRVRYLQKCYFIDFYRVPGSG